MRRQFKPDKKVSKLHSGGGVPRSDERAVSAALSSRYP